MIENLKTEKATLQTQVDTITAEKGELNTQLATEQEKYNTLVAEKTELTNTYNALVESNNLTLEEKAELETQIAEKQNQIDEQLANITALNSTIAERDATILSLQNQMSEISKQIDEFTISYSMTGYSIALFVYKTNEDFVLDNYSNFFSTTVIQEDFTHCVTTDSIDGNVSSFYKMNAISKYNMYNISNSIGSSLFSIDESLFLASDNIVDTYITFNGESYDESQIENGKFYEVWFKASFEYNENNEVVRTNLYIDIRPHIE